MNVPGGRVGRTRGPAITLPVRRSTRQAQPPRTRGLDRLDHPRLRGLDRSSVRPALRVIELVEITARESVQLVDERTRSSDTPAAGPRSTIRVRRSTSPLDHPGSLVSTGSTTRGCAGSTPRTPLVSTGSTTRALRLDHPGGLQGQRVSRRLTRYLP